MKRSELKSIIKECIQELKEEKLASGMDFKEAQANAKTLKGKKIKITHGSRTNKFHFITKDDRDFDVSSVWPEEFLKFKNEKDAIDVINTVKRI